MKRVHKQTNSSCVSFEKEVTDVIANPTKTTTVFMEHEKKDDAIVYEDLSRRDVRSLIFHLLYIADSFEYQESFQSMVDLFCDGFNIIIPRHSEVFCVAKQIIDQKDALDIIYEPFLSNWRMDRLSVCTKLILRYATWELKHTKIDSRIIINEAIELAKYFAESGAHKFINGILDKVCKEVGEQ